MIRSAAFGFFFYLLLCQVPTSIALPTVEHESPRHPPDEVAHGTADIQECLLCLDYGKLLLQDTAHVLSSPAYWDKKDWLTFSIATITVVGTAALLDDPIEEGMQRNRNSTTDDMANIFEPFGAEYSLGVLGGFYLTGVAFENQKAKSVAIDGFAASLIASGIITPTLKLAVGRSRPDHNEGTYTFHPFGGKYSFPSFHTTQAFTVATVISTHYDSLWIKITTYGVATLVCLARIDHNAHFTSDVVAGALIGTAVGNAVVHLNQQKRDHQQMQKSFVPLIEDDLRGMEITFTF